MGEAAIIGIGNPYRGDDAAGWDVVDLLEERVGKGVSLYKERGGIAELMDILAHHRTVVIVDACSSGSIDGPWKRFDLKAESLSEEIPLTSTHGFGVLQAISLAKNLDYLPEKVILYAIKGSAFQMKAETVVAVRESAIQVAEAILQEEDIRSCMNRV